MHRLNHLTRVAALGALVAIAGCNSDKRDLFAPSLPTGGDMFKSYVAIGNSITSGYQSGGINDSTQRQSYARLLAGQMGTQYHYASLQGRGCTPPIANTQTGALVGTGSTSSTCDLRAGASVTDILNNVAVPGARVLDPTSSSTVASNALTTFILGGKSQVQRALDASPTFVSIWIGANDVLVAGLSGILVPQPALGQAGIISTLAVFQANYDLMITQLLAGAPGLKGVLIGVPQVANLPTMSAGAVIAATPAIQAGISAAAGKTVNIDPNCTGSSSLIDVPQMIPQLRSGALPPIISCLPGAYPFPIGDLFVLDPTEQATLSAAINAYNAYISAKAASIGFAYYDPNPLFAAKRANGEIPPFPNLASTNQTFGLLVSLDGVHPSGAAHILLANEMITAINAKYSTALKPVQ